MDTFESELLLLPTKHFGDEHKQFGLGRNAWLSGTSSWIQCCGYGNGFWGVRPEADVFCWWTHVFRQKA
ncbi:hypothetical protein O9992_22180 [Vibrio lentus]|nr:hypothetical protein [Vibrio lentus]